MTDCQWLLNEIGNCNEKLQYLAENPDKAKEIVDTPGLLKDRTGVSKITYKNKIELEREAYVDELRSYLNDYNLGLRSQAYAIDRPKDSIKYLAFLDILGYSEIVKNNTLLELTTLVKNLTRDIQTALTVDNSGKAKLRLYTYGLAPDVARIKINSILLSDTIIFWSDDASDQSFFELIKAIKHLIQFNAIYMSIALRGVITVGELSYNDLRISHPQLVVDQSSLFGKAIVEAYVLEKKQQWLGCVVTDKAIQHFKGQNPSQSLSEDIFNNYLIEYEVPYKKKDATEMKGLEYVIKWASTVEMTHYDMAIRNCFMKRQKLDNIPSSPEIQEKYNNTLAFVDYVFKRSSI